MPRLLVKANRLNARAWVLCVLFSLIIVRRVLHLKSPGQSPWR